MPNLTPKTFPDLAQCDALSPGSIESHLRLYEGYVRKYNELMANLHTQQDRDPLADGPDNESLKADITFALGAIKNHELFFDILGPPSDGPNGDLSAALVNSFHSLPHYLLDLRQSALISRGWVWTAYDLDHDYLFNYASDSPNGLPVWNAVPILAIDLYGHAYFYDYGNNRRAYIEAVMKCMNWGKVATRLAAAWGLCHS